MSARRTYTQAEIDRIRRLCDTHGSTTAATIVGCRVETVAAMRRRGWTVGHRGRAVRPIPTDFAIQAAHMTLCELASHYGTGRKQVDRWAEVVGRAPRPRWRRKPLPIPLDVKRRAAELGIAGAADSYGVHRGTVRTWLRASAAAADRRRPVGWAEHRAAQRAPTPIPPRGGQSTGAPA